MVRAPACHAGGRGFEPRLFRQSFASVDVEKVKPRKLDEDKATAPESKYQLLLRTSNPGALVLMGKMIANEGGAITCKFIYGVEASTVMQWIVNPPVLTTPGSIPGYSTNSPVMD